MNDWICNNNSDYYGSGDIILFWMIRLRRPCHKKMLLYYRFRNKISDIFFYSSGYLSLFRKCKLPITFSMKLPHNGEISHTRYIYFLKVMIPYFSRYSYTSLIFVFFSEPFLKGRIISVTNILPTKRTKSLNKIFCF